MKNFVLTLAALVAGLFVAGTAADAYARNRRPNNNGNVLVKIDNPGFRNDVVIRANANNVRFNANAFGHVNGFGNVNNFHGHVNGSGRVNGIHGVNGFQVLRFNTFGTRTVVDGFGNVFEVDINGNAVKVGNRGGFNQFGGFNKIHVPGASVQFRGFSY
jgi:hypothetical protein